MLKMSLIHEKKDMNYNIKKKSELMLKNTLITNRIQPNYFHRIVN